MNQGSGRRPIVAANWKMYTTPATARELGASVRDALIDLDRSRVDVVLCPPFISLSTVGEILRGALDLGAQNMHWEDQGAFTGEISPVMLADLCRYVIVGHSERRQHFGETDHNVHLKVRAAFAHGLTPILCVGESRAQRDAGETHAWIALQVRGALHGIAEHDLMGMVIAYEPLWAIGSGTAATADDANQVAALIRVVVGAMCSPAAAKAVRIQYGGSVSAKNAAEFLAAPEIDGALVGGASLKPADFAAIVFAAAH